MNHGIRLAFGLLGIVAAVLVTIVVLLSFDRPPITAVQRGFRGVGMEQVYNPREVATYLAANQPPELIPSLGDDGPRASEIYENVQVLGHLSEGEFTRAMLAMTAWVAPEQGCTYCHNPENMASEELYTYKVARRMIQMTQHINADYQPHVAETGVTCHTCHRGQPVPEYIWFNEPPASNAAGMLQVSSGQNKATPLVNNSSLPSDPLTPYFEGAHSIRVQGDTALPTSNRHSIKEAEWTYALMVHFSQALGVNCTFCHNSRNFGDWSQSSPQRVSAWHGIGMTRDINQNYLKPLQDVFPDYRLGPTGDVAKVNCSTCHQGVYKPLFGVSMLADYPEFRGPERQATPASAATPAPVLVPAPLLIVPVPAPLLIVPAPGVGPTPTTPPQ